MRVPSYELAARPSQRAFVHLTRSLGGELDDVGKAAMRRPNFFGNPFLRLTQSLLRGPSAWSVGERELFAAVVSRANSCQFCVGTHGEIAAKELGRDVLLRLDEGTFSPRATAAGGPKCCGAEATACLASSCGKNLRRQTVRPRHPTGQARDHQPPKRRAGGRPTTAACVRHGESTMSSPPIHATAPLCPREPPLRASRDRLGEAAWQACFA